MKKIKAIAAVLIAAAAMMCFAACGESESSGIDIEKPDAAASPDEANVSAKKDAVEGSSNVNGKRFNMTLREFSDEYNNAMTRRKESDRIIFGNWNKRGDATKDNNGVEIQYWYYDGENISFTATVEIESNKILNIGCGTTMGQFTSTSNGQKNSDIILGKAAMMAKVVCGFSDGSEGVLQDIFYRTATESDDSLWYKGFVFNLSTEEDKEDSNNEIMLFRVFPITDDLKKEWKLEEY